MSRKKKVICNVHLDVFFQDGGGYHDEVWCNSKEYDQIVSEIKSQGIEKYATTRTIYHVSEYIIEVHIKIDMRNT